MVQACKFLRYRAWKGEVAVGAERSMVQVCRFESVPELVAWDAEAGTESDMAVWLAMWMLVASEKEGWCGESLVLGSRVGVGAELRAASCSLRSPGERRSSGVGAKEEFVLEVSDVTIGARRRCEAASSAASEMEIADAFLRVLKANFLGGLKDWRIFCSFSERALMAWSCQGSELRLGG